MDQPQNPDRHDPLKPVPPAPEHPDSVPEAPPLTPMAWLMQNGIYIVLFLAAVIWLYKNTGLDGLWRAALVVLGLSFVVFIHELGHFLAAKWCDVHVTAFSLGFGPAIPGCSFVRGETTYLVGILPLGGYVAMVGEGPEGEEDESYPRSFKNKSVGQRMLIISAGVIMNVLLGAVCFIFVYMTHGRERPVAVVWAVEPGSPAWTAGVQTGGNIERVGSTEKPFFDDMRISVAVSQAGQKIPFTFQPRDGGESYSLDLEPRRDYEDIIPVVGIVSAGKMQLLPPRASRSHEIPASYASAAAHARIVPFRPGDALIEAKIEGQENATTLKPGLDGIRQLTELFREHPFKTITVRAHRAGQAEGSSEAVKLSPEGFTFDDRIVAMTDPATPDETFRLSALPLDPTRPKDDPMADPFAYRRRLRELAGKPILLEVERAGEKQRILVPTAYTWVLPGVRLQMGQIAAVRDHSEASKADLVVSGAGNKGDILTEVTAIRPDQDGKQSIQTWTNGPAPAPGAKTTALDPLSLPFELARFARAPQRDPEKKMQVRLTVLRDDKETHKDRKRTKIDRDLAWDDSWNDQEDLSLGKSSPLSIPQLGLAYRVDTTIDQVKEGSAAASAGLKKGDRIDRIAILEGGKLRTDEGTWSKEMPLETERIAGQKAFDSGAYLSQLLQKLDFPTVRLRIYRDGKLLEEPVEVKTVLDRNWPSTDSQGLAFMLDFRLQKADGFFDAVVAGVNETGRFIKMMYLNLSSLLSGRISTKTLGGPIEIAAQTFSMAEDPFLLILWLGMISINLAVVNFLPIPVLDGGHMVFLIYEWLRGRPPSPTVQAAATYVGLAMILSLMVFVIYLDVMRRFFGS